MAMTLITTNTHTGDSDATSSFTSGIDSTYKLYIFKFIDINPTTDDVHLTFQANATDTADYNDINITSTWWRAGHTEADGVSFGYHTGTDLADSTDFQKILNIGNGADESLAGELFLFNPSNTTYAKHFYSTTNGYHADNSSVNAFLAGYFNTTTAIDDIQFKMSSGNLDGTIKMYGVG